MADRVGVISKGELIVVEEKTSLMKKLGKKELTLNLTEVMDVDSARARRMEPRAAGRRPRIALRVRRQCRADRRALAAAADERRRHRLQGPPHPAELAGGHFRQPRPRGARRMSFNLYGTWAIYRFEMARALRTLWQSLVTPVITTSLYFVVFGAAIGSRMTEIGGVPYGAFIVPGLIMLSLFTQSIFNASFGIFFPKFTGTIYELLSAPISPLETVIGYVGAAATKSIVLGLVILATAAFFVPIQIVHPVLDGDLPGADRGHLLPVRLHHRHLGPEFRADPVHPDADRDPADLPRRRLLLARHAAASRGGRSPISTRSSI